MEIMPTWTRPPTISDGRDHLGMQAPSISLYATLVPNITNVTKRVRYYSLYPWLCDQYARNKGSSDWSNFRRFIRRAEALYALSCATLANNAHAGISGIDWATKLLVSEKAWGTFQFAKAADSAQDGAYLKAANGAFGQIYMSPLFGLGVLSHTNHHTIPVPSISIGEKMNRAFADAIGDTAKTFMAIIERGEATLQELEIIGRAFGPESIHPDSEENKLLCEAVFGDDFGNAHKSGSRRETMLLLLHFAKIAGKMPSSQELRWSMYSRCLPSGEAASIPEPLSQRCELWRAYQAHELYQVSVESLFHLLLETMSADLTPVEEVLRITASSVVAELHTQGETWADLRGEISLSHNPSSGENNSERSLANIVTSKGEPAKRAAAGLRLLATLDQRWPGTVHAVGHVFSLSQPIGMQYQKAIMGGLNFFRNRESQALEKCIFDFLQRFIVEQHLSVAIRKLHHQRKSTFRFELNDGTIRRISNIEPGFTNPRLDSALIFLRDLKLLCETGLTEKGRRILAAI